METEVIAVHLSTIVDRYLPIFFNKHMQND